MAQAQPHPPSEFMCPIGMELMNDPVLCEDGHSYERETIKEWLQRNPVSPLTRQPMFVSSMRPNYALKAAIDRWKKTSPPVPSAPPVNPAYSLTPYYQQPSYQNTPSIQVQIPIPQPPVQTTLQPSDTERRRIAARILCILASFGLFIIIVLISILQNQKNVNTQNDDDK